MDDLKELFKSFPEREGYKRVDESHPLDLFVGMDDNARWTMVVVCTSQPKQVYSSRMIEVRVGRRKDKNWAISLSLINNDYRDMFVLFCTDLIESSRSIRNKEKGVVFITQRYEEWKKMLANSRPELLSAELVKGLIGEMHFLETELMSKYDPAKAALSWVGPKNLHQDFCIDSTWYEVKTIASGRREVDIPSVEQLDNKEEGHLIVVVADNTSITNDKHTNINILYHSLMSKLPDSAKEYIGNMLLHRGYFPRPEYENEEYTYKIIDIQHYRVDSEFPCMRKRCLPDSVTNVSYSLLLPNVQSFRED